MTWAATGFASGRFCGGGVGGVEVLVYLVPSLALDVLNQLFVGWSPLFGGVSGWFGGVEGLSEREFVKFGMLGGAPGFNLNIFDDFAVA